MSASKFYTFLFGAFQRKITRIALKRSDMRNKLIRVATSLCLTFPCFSRLVFFYSSIYLFLVNNIGQSENHSIVNTVYWTKWATQNLKKKTLLILTRLVATMRFFLPWWTIQMIVVRYLLLTPYAFFDKTIVINRHHPSWLFFSRLRTLAIEHMQHTTPSTRAIK